MSPEVEEKRAGLGSARHAAWRWRVVPASASRRWAATAACCLALAGGAGIGESSVGRDEVRWRGVAGGLENDRDPRGQRRLEAIVDPGALTAPAQQAGTTQVGQMARYPGLRSGQGLGHFTDAELGFGTEQQRQRQARLVGETAMQGCRGRHCRDHWFRPPGTERSTIAAYGHESLRGSGYRRRHAD